MTILLRQSLARLLGSGNHATRPGLWPFFILQMVLLLAACSDSRVSGPELATLSVSGLETVLQDVVEDLPDRRIRWRTYWQLCWEVHPGAIAYELQALTSEGFSSQLRRQNERCFRIEAAAGENERSQGFVNRDLWLKLQSAQLAYRVRAVLDKNRFSEWSPSMAVGSQSAKE